MGSVWTGAKEWYEIRQGKQADMCTTQLRLNLINSPSRSFGSSQHLIRVTSPEIDLIQFMTHVGFQRNDSNQLVTEAKNIDFESAPDSALRWMDAWHWFDFICAQLTFFKHWWRARWMAAYSIKILFFSTYTSRSFFGKFIKWIQGLRACPRNRFDSTTDQYFPTILI